MRTIRRVHFNRLPESCRRRFVESVAGRGSPIVLQTGTSFGLAVFAWVFLGLCAAGALALAGAREFGDPYDPFQNEDSIPLYGGIAFVGVAAGLGLARRIALKGRLPYAPGTYLFPMVLVEAPSTKLRLYPMNAITDMKTTHHYTNGVYTQTVIKFTFEDGKKKSISVQGKEKAESVGPLLSQYGQKWNEAFEARDGNVLAWLDPFLEARMTPEVEDAAAELPMAGPEGDLHVRDVSWFLERHWLVGLAAGAILAWPTWHLRNRASDEAAWSHAEQLDEVSTWQRYASASPTHREEILSERLPWAEFAAIENQRSVARFREFIRNRADHELAAEARKRVHGLYEDAWREFESKAADDPEARAVLKRLVDWLEGHDSPQVAVRFGAPGIEAFGGIDEAAKSMLDSSSLGAVKVLHPIAPHFTVERCHDREGAIVGFLQKGFGEVFPNDVLGLDMGPRIAGVAAPSSAPTIDVSYQVSNSGTTYYSEKGNGVYVGIAVRFQVTMRVPDGGSDLSFELEVEPPESFEVQSGSSALFFSDPDASSVYDVMASRAFEALAERLRSRFFKS